MVRIGSDHEHLDLTLIKADRLTLAATVVGSGIKATHVVQPHYSDEGFGDLADYFTALEQAWRGWDGPRSWRSLEGELSLTASHTGSHVLLRVELENGPFNGTAEWTARLDLIIDAGEELSHAADGVRDEVGPSARK
ncbi:DUF6228 family protein [Saccharopolyspora sp. NPDC050389]|uniref:DUF6228 family protein n=1 Tax=Saccharopolyspora sp. NPDC050389 TaxID=3155516 RepID=UPI0033E19E74